MQHKVNRKLKLFHNLLFVYNSIKIMKKSSKLLDMLEYWSLKETGMSYKQRFFSADNRWQNIWQKVKTSSKSEQDQTSTRQTIHLNKTDHTSVTEDRKFVGFCVHFGYARKFHWENFSRNVIMPHTSKGEME